MAIADKSRTHSPLSKRLIVDSTAEDLLLFRTTGVKREDVNQRRDASRRHLECYGASHVALLFMQQPSVKSRA